MERDETRNVRLDIFQILRKTFDVYKKGFSVFIGIALAGSIINEFCGIIFGKIDPNNMALIFFINILVSSWTSLFTFDFASCYYRKVERTFKESFDLIKGRYWRFTAVSVSIIFIFGLVLLLARDLSIIFVLAMYYLMAIFILSYVLVAIENVLFIDAFKKSYRMVMAHFFSVLSYILAITLFAILILTLIVVTKNNVIAINVVSVFIMPLFIISQVALYYEIKAKGLTNTAG
jgi:hypothetical protein